MNKYDPVKTEAKWTKIWHQTNLNKTTEEVKDKFYNLVMFPYPSGNLHIGHWYNFAPADTLGRFSKMHGKDVLEPFGYDSFGLPAENAAIERGLMADKWTDQNIADMTLQMNKIGAMYDWDKTLKTSEPNYYKWTQWMFLKLFQDKKAYQKDGLVNWCPNDKTVL
jgi:leucyl-tRNA synthetase